MVLKDNLIRSLLSNTKLLKRGVKRVDTKKRVKRVDTEISNNVPLAYMRMSYFQEIVKSQGFF